MKKRFLGLLLTLAMIVSLVPSATFAEPTGRVIGSGECGADGDNLTWTMYDTGVLSISGEGAMKDYSSESKVPWYNYRTAIETVELPDGMTNIGNYAFNGCSNLPSVTIPNSVTSIGNFAFSSCSNLPSVTIPESVTSIGISAFLSCSNLTNVEIPNSVKKIGISAFASCGKLTSVTIPESVTSIDKEAFAYCARLTEINYNAKSVGDLASDNKIFFNAGTSGSGINVIFGDSVEKIPAYLFNVSSNNSAFAPKVTSVTIPYNVTSIGYGAFYSCSQLTDVYYNSTEAAWKCIKIAGGNTPLTNANIHYITVCDIDGDGIIDEADLTMLLRHVAKISIIEDENLLNKVDFNHSGAVDAADVTILAQYLEK